MEDKYMLYDILASEKAMVANMATALNEASCDGIYKKYHDMFEDSTKEAKDLFNLAYNKGWYTLEEAETQKISECKSKLEGVLNSL